MLGALTTAECITLYFVVHSSWFLLGFSIVANSTLFYGVNFSVKFQNFKENLELYLPKITNFTSNLANIENSEVEITKICQKDEELPLKACRLYVNGSTYGDIERKLGLSHPEQAKRLLQHGIKELLENQVKK
jgi:hypothetical protein